MKKLITFSITILFITTLTNKSIAQWPSSPTVNVPMLTTATDDQAGIWVKSTICSDGAGGAITCWCNTSAAPYPISVARVNNLGTVLWTVTFTSGAISGGHWSPTIISDNAGGAIAVWDWYNGTENDIYGARVGPNGNVIWGGTTGLAIANGSTGGNKYEPVLCTDGGNGAIITWGGNYTNVDIYARHVSGTGTLSWGNADGLHVCYTDSTQWHPVIVADGAGGAIIAWEDWRNGTTKPSITNSDIYAKRIDASGATVWGGSFGIPVCDTTFNQTYPVMISDGAGGAIVAWLDSRTGGPGIYAQKISSNGTMSWASNGNLVRSTSCENVRLATDGSGGAYIVWNTNNGLPGTNAGSQNVVAQLVNAAGVLQWPTVGKSISTASGTQWRPDIINTPDGGAIIAWGDYKNSTTSDIYAQKVDTAGPLWTVNGTQVSTAACGQGRANITGDGCNGAIVTWMDQRGNCSTSDIYAQNINADSTLGGTSGSIGCPIVPPPHAAFQADSTSFCANNCATFTDMSTGTPTSWLWTFQGGSPATSTLQNPYVCYFTGGTFDVKLVVGNGGGKDSTTNSGLIHVTSAPPTPNILVSFDTLKCTFDSSYVHYEWSANGVHLPGDTLSYYIISGGGNYSVVVTNSAGCSIATGIVLGMQQFIPGSGLQMIPNPAINEIIIKGYTLSGKNEITIFNVIGETIYTEELNSPEKTINCEKLPPGIYFLQVANERGRWTGRFAKE